MFTKKSIMLVLIVAVFITGMVSPLYAEHNENRDYYAGEIISVNAKDHKITIYDYMYETKRTFFVENGVGPDLKPGVEVMVSVQKGTNTAKRVKLIIPRSLKI